ncbi:iron complex transport system permease protein [Symbiobacterium terraclitae]|uniref:Iron complex transport system permease protein n=1 Tax=Symbiobacterium terraclitae TaxID=557451 RepID=A0ABS4JSM1_9FIRM|nr:iron ABC transporter permease [Symbiobacterium terraclitae]MBP2018515.1 iron complex transport system permease protein [Symbiobacterium terraclitae]
MWSGSPARVSRPAALLLLAGALVVVALLSLRVGSIPVTTADALAALTDYDPDSYTQTVVRTMRLPRTVIGLGVGAALAVAGSAMQAATRNPLAEPSLLGVNAGASFAIVAAVYLGHMTHPLQYIWFAFAGALGASVLVYGIASAGGGASPVKLALAGVIISALLGSWTTALLLLNKETLEVVRFWLAGSLAGRSLNLLPPVVPFLAAGLLGALLLGRQLNTLSLGEDAARSLGMHTGRMRAAVAGLVVLLAGSAVALAGPVGFVGLAVPHIVRAWVGSDYRWILPFSLLLGPALLLGADILGRVLARPSELQVGVVTALVGAPFLISMARRRRVAER